jgi:hypothetical protein
VVQACSILYKTKLPLLLVFNKTDVVRHEFAQQWMKDYEVFSAALEKDTTYAATLSRSLSLVLSHHLFYPVTILAFPPFKNQRHPLMQNTCICANMLDWTPARRCASDWAL